MKNPYLNLQTAGWSELAQLGWDRLNNIRHGDFPGWLEAISALPSGDGYIQLNQDAPVLGLPAEDLAGVS